MPTKEELRDIIHRYNDREKTQLIQDIIDGKINLSDYDNVEKSDVYNYIIKKIKKEVAAKREKIREAKAINSKDEKKAKKIIVDGNTNKSYYKYSFTQLQEYHDTIESLINSDSTTISTKNKLSRVLKSVTELIENYKTKRNNKEEKAIRELVSLYDSGNIEEAYRRLLQAEGKLYKMSNTKAISTITKNRFNKLYKEYKAYKEELEIEYLVKGILYILKSTNNSIEENQEEFSLFYDKCYKRFSEGKLDNYITDEDDYLLLKNLLEQEKDIKRKEVLIKQRGYDDDRLDLLDELLDRYVNNKEINNYTHKIGIGPRTISKNSISSYLIKFESEPLFTGKKLELYKEFAEEYGNRLLTWIILQRNIDGTDGISKEEIVSYCNMNNFDDSNTLQKRINDIKKHINITDKSLYPEEKEDINSRIKSFIEQYESAKNSQKIKAQ